MVFGGLFNLELNELIGYVLSLFIAVVGVFTIIYGVQLSLKLVINRYFRFNRCTFFGL